MKTNTLLLRRALLFCVFLFGIFGVSWGQAGFFTSPTGSVISYTVNGAATTNRCYGDIALLGSTNTFVIDGFRGFTWKGGNGNVCSVQLHYRVYKSGSPSGSFTTVTATSFNSYFPSQTTSCGSVAGNSNNDQMISNTSAAINVMALVNSEGAWVFEYYFSATGSTSSSSGCNAEAFFNSNSGNNRTITFTVTQNPGFENSANGWIMATDDMTTSVTGTQRSGSGRLQATCTSSNARQVGTHHGYRVQIPSSGTNYVHVIGWSRTATDGANDLTRMSAISIDGGSQVSGTLTASGVGSYARITTSGTATNGKIYVPRIDVDGNSTSGGDIYGFDDIIIYTSTSSGADVTKPNAPSSLTSSRSGSNNVLSWTDGTDNASNTSGIEGTLVLRATGNIASLSALNTSILDQAYYSTTSTQGPTSINDGTDTWTVISNGISSNTYTDVNGGNNVTYAVFMRDKAYNYSTGVSFYVPNAPTITSFTPSSGYVGSTITITGTNFTGATAVSISGVAVASYTVNSATEISAVVAAGGATGAVSVTTPGGTATSSSSFTFNGFISTQDGDWSSTSTWLGGVLPSAGSSVTIDHNLTVNSSVSIAPTTVVINSSKSLTFGASGALTATTVTNNGSIVMTSGGTLIIAGGGTFANGNNTFISGAGTITFAGTGTVTGTVGFNNVNIAGGVNFGSSSTINGALQINSGGFVNTNAPIYASGSTLRYNSGGTYGRGTEWSATSGAGYPHHVQISSSTTLNLGANSGTSTTRQIAGDLTIDANSTLTMNAAGQAMTAELIVKGNYINNGTTTLSGTIGGDLVLEGDLTDNNAFNANGRAIFFRGNNTQSITSNSDPLDIDVARLEKSGGEIVLGQNLLVDETANPIQFAGTLSVLNLNGYTATFGKTGTASQISMNSTSAIKGSASSTLTILGTGSFGTLRFDQTTPGTTNVLGTLTVNRTNTGSVTLANNLQIATSLVLTDGTLSLGANTLAINGSVSRTSGTIDASSGTVAFGNASNLSLPTSLFTGNVANISKTGGAGTVTLNDNLTITGNLTTTASTGAFIVATSKELTINGTLTNNGAFTLKNGATLDPGTSYSQSVGGTYNVEQVVTGAGGSTPNGRGWYIGSPVSGATSNVFNPQNSTDLLYHWSANQTTPAWAQINAGSGSALEVGKGYLIRMGAASTTLNFSSNTLNNGAINIPCYRQASATFQGYNLISNPYPSYLNWASIYAANSSSFEDKIWYRIGNASNAMVFDTYAGGVGTSNYGGQPVSGYIPPMQAVWVRLNSSITPGTSATNLTLNNEMRSHYAGSAGAGLKSNIQDFPMFVRLNLLQDNKKDQVLVYMRPEAQHLIDAYDAEKMFLTNYPQIYTKINDKKLVINAMKNNKTQTIVPLFLELPSAGVYTLNTEEFNIENGLILLEDKQEGVIQDMTFNENYVFYGNSGLLANRFFIHFKLPAPIITATGPSNNWIDSESENTWSEIHITTNGKGKILVSQDIEQTDNVKSFVTVTDASGKLVLEEEFEGVNGAVELLDVVNGVYFVRVESNGQIAVKKVLVQF